jgi:hypothetical protein
MSLRTRIKDLLPVLIVFAIVAAFATFVVVEYVVREPVVVPEGSIPAEPTAVDGRDERADLRTGSAPSA